MKKLCMSAIVLAALVSVVSCDKDDDKPNNSTLSKLQAKWGVQNIQMEFSDGDSTYTGTAADYLDFRTDNRVYSQVQNEKDTLDYKLVNDTTLVIDGDTSKISQLTGSQFVVVEKFVVLGDTSIITYNLKK